MIASPPAPALLHSRVRRSRSRPREPERIAVTIVEVRNHGLRPESEAGG